MTTADDLLSTALRLHQSGQLAEAETLYRQVLVDQPRHPDALHLAGLAAHQSGRHEQAIELLQQAIAARPASPLFVCHLGEVHQTLGQVDLAQDCYRQAIALDPRLAAAHYNLANLLRVQGDIEGASAEYRKVLDVLPDHVETLLECGKLLQQHGCFAESLQYLDRALRARPDSAAAHYQRGIALRQLRRTTDSVVEFHQTLRCQANFPDAHAQLAAIYNYDGQPDEALRYCQAGLAAGVTSTALYDIMALALHSQGRGTEAIECYRRSVALAPHDAAEHSNLIYVLNFEPGLDPQTLYAEHLEWARRHAEPLTAQAAPHLNDRAPDRRLRIGYVSPHFREHAVNFFTEPILLAHDHEQFEIFCYSSVPQPDDVTKRLENAADHWRDVLRLTDEQLAQRVRDDQIDILVDLSGHMGVHRLLAFARKPAPIQVTYIGYQNTTGMTAMDYRLTDERADPTGETDRYYTERLVRLPRSFFCYQPAPAPEVSPSPASANGWVTFGSFNNYAKVSPAVVDTWLEILARVPESRLIVLGYSPGYLERHWHALAAKRGIDPNRVELANRCSRADYLKLIARADIALDPFPCNGHTTICDALWMGLPVVMLEGQMYANRYGGTALEHVGLDDLIATSRDRYVEAAVRLAGDLERLATLRANLRQTFCDSVLMDTAGFTRNLEQAYRQMWLEWCQKHPTPE